jgi:uncharacterized protein with HEPN domain
MRHMLDHARETVATVRGRARRDIDTDRILQLALTRMLEIIGEAATRVSQDGRTRYPDIPWQDFITTRNRIIHGYDTVDYDIVWRITQRAQPPDAGDARRGMVYGMKRTTVYMPDDLKRAVERAARRAPVQ